jgi:glycosyltransferase involved in cell wall biosynthesis
MSVYISAIVCTLNRANYLRKALQSLVSQTLDMNLYEILVIDNCSTDNTKQVATEEFAQIPNLSYLFEPVLGLSQARNTGWQNAIGKYVAYLDDDAIASPQWLEKILEVFETVQPQPACVGGKVTPIWEAPKPDWLPDKLLNYFTMADYSETPIFLSHAQFNVGANIAFPKWIFEKVGAFQTGLGRTNKKLLSMEENLFQEKIREMGHLCFYHPDISVQHHIPVSRLTKNWLLRRLYWEGISSSKVQIYRESLSTHKRVRLGVSQIRRLLSSPQGLIGLFVSTEEPEDFVRQCMTLSQIGYVIGILGIVG